MNHIYTRPCSLYDERIPSFAKQGTTKHLILKRILDYPKTTSIMGAHNSRLLSGTEKLTLLEIKNREKYQEVLNFWD